jgi:hypothetical protein
MEKHPENQRDKGKDAGSETIQNERRKEYRRTNESEGYAYIEMVGWMDRRERIRRNDDPSCF